MKDMTNTGTQYLFCSSKYKRCDKYWYLCCHEAVVSAYLTSFSALQSSMATLSSKKTVFQFHFSWFIPVVAIFQHSDILLCKILRKGEQCSMIGTHVKLAPKTRTLFFLLGQHRSWCPNIKADRVKIASCVWLLYMVRYMQVILV